MKSIDVEIGRQLKNIRNAQRVSCEDCALELGVSLDAYKAFELGEVQIAGAQLYLLAQLLRSPISSFFDRIGCA